MVDRIRQLFLSLLGIAVFGFVFYLVFREDRGLMLGIIATLVGLVLIILLIALLARLRDYLIEKRRRRPFKYPKGTTGVNKTA